MQTETIKYLLKRLSKIDRRKNKTEEKEYEEIFKIFYHEIVENCKRYEGKPQSVESKTLHDFIYMLLTSALGQTEEYCRKEFPRLLPFLTILCGNRNEKSDFGKIEF